MFLTGVPQKSMDMGNLFAANVIFVENIVLEEI